MATTGARRASATQVKSEKSGRPNGIRASLAEAFLKALLEDFAECGKAAIRKAREQSPVQFLRLIAALVPRSWLGGEPEPEPVPAIVVPGTRPGAIRTRHDRMPPKSGRSSFIVADTGNQYPSLTVSRRCGEKAPLTSRAKSRPKMPK